MSLLPFFQWCYQSAIGEAIRESIWLFPVIEAFHLVGLGLVVGAVLLVDVRLLGAGLVKQPVPQLAAAVQPWLLGSLALMFTSGGLLFLSLPLFPIDLQAFGNNLAATVLLVAGLVWHMLHPPVADTAAALPPATGELQLGANNNS